MPSTESSSVEEPGEPDRLRGRTLYAEARGRLVSIEIPNRMDDLPSNRAGIPRRGAATMPAPPGSVKDGGASDDDAQREMQRAPGADERPRQLQVGTRVDEHPRVFVGVAEAPELLEAPADHALVLERELVRGWWMLCCRHTP